LSSFLFLGLFPIAFVEKHVANLLKLLMRPDHPFPPRHISMLKGSAPAMLADSECNIHSLLTELFARPATQNVHMRQVLMTESAYNHTTIHLVKSTYEVMVCQAFAL